MHCELTFLSSCPAVQTNSRRCKNRTHRIEFCLPFLSPSRLMQRTMASPRLGVNLPGNNGGDSPSKNSGFFNGKKHGDAAVQRTQLLVVLSVALNVIVIGLLLFKCASPSTTSQPIGIQPTNFATADSSAQEALVAAHARELSTLQSTLSTLKLDLKTSQTSEKLANSDLKDLQMEHASLTKKYEKLQEEAKSGGVQSDSTELKELQQEHASLQKKYEKLQDEVKSGAIAPAASLRETGDCACRQQTRLSSDDLALQGSKFDLTTHEFEWKCDEELTKPKGNMTFCPETATSEQYFQLTFFDRPGAGSKVAVRKGRPVSPTCVQLPPRDYVWPTKHAQIPVTKGTDGVNWPNLRVATLKDLLVFNRGTPKNLYHFNASFYDYEQEAIVSHAAKYIPFDQKVRIMMDIGSGGGSLGLLLKRRYDVQVVSTVFADWPYCEYITERGNLCMYLDAMEAMPFAKFSYDILHSSWVFHALLNHQLVHTFLEQNRILRPGGYIWLNGGWSRSQVETIENLFLTQLGYTVIYQHKRPVAHPGKTHFDTVPYDLDWEVIMVKPIRADEKTCRIAQAEHNPENKHGRA